MSSSHGSAMPSAVQCRHTQEDAYDPPPQRAWSVLAPLIAARRSHRRYNPATGLYESAARSFLPKRVPNVAAAVPLYNQLQRTTILAFDLDAKRSSVQQVIEDQAGLLRLLEECGGRSVTDRSPATEGRHIITPLPLGVSVTREDLEPILLELARRFPTLDIGPMLGPRQGSITPPGSATKDGTGHRVLDGTLGEAVRVFVDRSESGFLPRLQARLGVVTSPRTSYDHPDEDYGGGEFPVNDRDVWEGSGHTARLQPRFRWSRPTPAAVVTYARTGRLDRRWASHSEARQSVLVHALLRGWSYNDVLSHRRDWPAFFDAYTRYQQRSERRRRADWAKACQWANQMVDEVRQSTHKNHKHTAGGGRSTAHAIQAVWLAAATEWVLNQWPGSGRRWTVLAVLQGLAWAATVKGELVDDVPVVGVGIRSLSLMCGMLPEATVAAVLRELRELPGAPILRVHTGTGKLPDRYALTTAARGGRPVVADQATLARVRIEPVHPAWRLLGGRGRRVYELVEAGLTASGDIQAASGLGRSEFHDTVAALIIAGLLMRPARGQLRRGDTGLDEFAAAHGVPAAVADRKQLHRRQRVAWWRWLSDRFTQLELAKPRWNAEDRQEWWKWACNADLPPDQPEPLRIPQDPWDSEDRAAWWAHHGVVIDEHDLDTLHVTETAIGRAARNICERPQVVDQMDHRAPYTPASA